MAQGPVDGRKPLPYPRIRGRAGSLVAKAPTGADPTEDPMRARPALTVLVAAGLLLTAAGCARSPAPPAPSPSKPASEPQPSDDQAGRSPAPPAPAPSNPTGEPEPAEKDAGRIVEMRGDLKIKRPGSTRWERVDRLQRFEAGDRIRVDSGFARIEFASGERMTLREGTVIQVQGYEPSPSDEVQRGLLRVGVPG